LHHQVCHQHPPQIPAGEWSPISRKAFPYWFDKAKWHVISGLPVQPNSGALVANGSAHLVAGVTMTEVSKCKFCQHHEFASIAVSHLSAPLSNFPAALKEQGCMYCRAATATTHGVARQGCNQNAADTLCDCMQLQSSSTKLDQAHLHTPCCDSIASCESLQLLIWLLHTIPALARSR